MKHGPTVLVLMGGPDAEREVSLDSGHAVARALRESNAFDVVEQIIDAPGVVELTAMGGDVFFPVLHGHWGEGGPLQELLEAIGLPFVGSGSRAAALAMHKLTTKAMMKSLDIPTPPAQLLRPDTECELTPPLVLKPIDDGSSVDLRICHTGEEVVDARAVLHGRRGDLLAEQYIAGRELTVGIVGDAALPIIEIIPAVEFYDYDAKYEREDTQYVIEPDLPTDVAETCVRHALACYEHLGCRDLARVDFMFDRSGPWFLEINTMPGFTSHSLVPMAAAHAGTPMPQLCAALVQRALERARQTSLPPGSGCSSSAAHPSRL